MDMLGDPPPFTTIWTPAAPDLKEGVVPLGLHPGEESSAPCWPAHITMTTVPVVIIAVECS
jgi:hypothetical protein